jgi:molybdopterin synthase catalytic subunit
MTTTIRLQREAFDVAAEAARMTHGRTDIGAVVTFTGLCRADESGQPIAALTLEHYPGMAEAEIARHVDEACARWPLLGVTVIHRYGRIAAGEVIVLVATRSGIRGGVVSDGLSENARTVLEAGGNGRGNGLG